MKQNKWIVTSLLLLAGCLLPDRAAAQWKVGVSAGYADNQYSIDTHYAYDFNFDGRGGVTVGIPVEYGILDWLAVRADFVYLQQGYSMQRAYDQGFRDRRVLGGLRNQNLVVYLYPVRKHERIFR